MAMNISLTPQLEEMIRRRIASGSYNSASEVVREALRLLEENDRVRAEQLRGFNQHLGQRLTALDRGDKVDPDVARARLHKKSQQRRKHA
jgi:antitoxin ParD1/3/4